MVTTLGFFQSLGLGIIISFFLIGILIFIFVFIAMILRRIRRALFKIKFSERETELFENALENNLNSSEFMKILLLNGISKIRAKDLVYIYKKLLKKMKGGKKDE